MHIEWSHSWIDYTQGANNGGLLLEGVLLFAESKFDRLMRRSSDSERYQSKSCQLQCPCTPRLPDPEEAKSSRIDSTIFPLETLLWDLFRLFRLRNRLG